jgi:nucleotide-binding universal stress UspA family protein/GNAT superfamily N-acetyltransferase
VPSSLFASVLVPSDLSPLSDVIVRTLARAPDIGRVHLVHFAAAGERERAQAVLDGQKETFSALNPAAAVTAEVEDLAGGDIPAAILAAAVREGAGLIVVGARRGFLSRSLLGRDATVVLTRSRTHVLIMRSPETFWPAWAAAPAEPQDVFSKVLFPTDFSRPARETLHLLAGTPGIGEVVLLHVIRMVEGDQAARVRSVREAETKLDLARSPLERAGVPVRKLIRFGSPCREICGAAADEKVGMVVMSRYGRMDYLRQVPLGVTTSAVACHGAVPLLVACTEIHLTVSVRELGTDEFYLAEKIWLDYHATKSDPATDRIFCVFVEDTPVSVARCKRHPDGFEVDGVFTWEEFRGMGYARKAMEGLVAACGSEDLYMYAVVSLVAFYASLGFVPVKERDLPPPVRQRYAWALGNLKGTNVCPMKRKRT